MRRSFPLLHVALVLSAILITACAGSTQRSTRGATDLSGGWTFEVPTGKTTAHGAITLKTDGAGYQGSLTTDQGNEVLPVKSLTLRGSEMRLVVNSPNGEVVFEGRLSDDQQTFDGIVTYHNGQRFPMSGHRKME